MSLLIRRSDWFIGDLEHYAAWYQSEASWEVAQSYLRAVSATLTFVANMPGVGRAARFSSPALRDLRFCLVERPFQKHLMFYRHDETTLYVERVIHGSRDLQRRLTQPPEVADRR
jgi:plasmid stabilization system protein ParE